MHAPSTRLLALTTCALGFSAFLSGAALGKTCELSIEGTDAMQYSTKELTVEKSCTEVKVTLKHSGKIAKAAMGHNWMLASEKDMPAIIAAGMKAGLANDFLPADPKPIAATKLVGGGESASTTFKMSDLKAGETYKYFCTFPGHAGLMTGTLIIK